MGWGQLERGRAGRPGGRATKAGTAHQRAHGNNWERWMEGLKVKTKSGLAIVLWCCAGEEAGDTVWSKECIVLGVDTRAHFLHPLP